MSMRRAVMTPSNGRRHALKGFQGAELIDVGLIGADFGFRGRQVGHAGVEFGFLLLAFLLRNDALLGLLPPLISGLREIGVRLGDLDFGPGDRQLVLGGLELGVEVRGFDRRQDLPLGYMIPDIDIPLSDIPADPRINGAFIPAVRRPRQRERLRRRARLTVTTSTPGGAAASVAASACNSSNALALECWTRTNPTARAIPSSAAQIARIRPVEREGRGSPWCAPFALQFNQRDFGD